MQYLIFHSFFMKEQVVRKYGAVAWDRAISNVRFAHGANLRSIERDNPRYSVLTVDWMTDDRFLIVPASVVMLEHALAGITVDDRESGTIPPPG